ncbi:MAG: sensor histidine kinase [Roseburia sp.]|nr:sensor histidine kinase [Roseburia sp.]
MNYLLAFILVTAMWVNAFAYVGKQERRDRFWLRVVLCVGIFYVLTTLFLSFMPGGMVLIRVIWRAIGMPVLFVFIYACFHLSLSLCLYYAMWAFMSWQLMCELWLGMIAFMQYLHVSTPVRELLTCLLIFVVGNLIIWFTLARWMPQDRKKNLGPRQLISAIVIFAAFEVVGYTPGIDNIEPGDGKWLVIYLAQLLLIVILYLQNELFKKSAMRQELAVMNMLWKKEQEQYELSKENIALINQKCHDLKHQIRAIRYMNKEEIDAYLEEIEESVEIYESMVKTGNEVLDTILTEKSLYCRERGITVSCVADGSQMEFINTIDLYAILGNALDNAIEAVEKFNHQEKRQIDVMIYRQQQFLVINIINPSKEKLVYDEELPRTTKSDRFHHGFGLKSIQYMVKKYDGHLNISEEDGCFSLKILMPIPMV